VLNHNLETVPRLYAQARPGADYRRSLELLRQAAAADPHLATKSGLMLGLGETDAEIHLTLRDLIASGCRLLTLGQYLQPSRAHLPVARFVTPEAFADWRRKALELGFSEAACGPLVRSSYRADALYQAQRPSSPHPGSAG
jgi:lipoic acid synthetase